MEVIAATRVVAILRAEHPNHLATAADVLVSCGICAVEFPLTTPGAFAALETFRRRARPEACVGAGTVLTAQAALSAVDAGAAYLVTPAFVPEVLEAAGSLRIPVLVGAYTATELVAAQRAGATAVKVFPAAIGGPRYVRLLREPLPDIPLVPSGGISLAEVPDYLRAGAVAVGLGSSLLGDALRTGAMEPLYERARALRRAMSADAGP
jgi:2-dehydro-3-deoxyphosphogluconate aldolase/(4S)-4-hydroxy-2-oxoglutarate aldolase